MNAVLEAIAEGWSWKLGKPVAIVATNRFGNALVQNEKGYFFLEEKRKSDDFVRDWEMLASVRRAEVALGPLAEGEVYYLVVPGCLGGKYAEENIRKNSLRELLAYSGEMARRIDDVPDRGSVIIAPTE